MHVMVFHDEIQSIPGNGSYVELSVVLLDAFEVEIIILAVNEGCCVWVLVGSVGEHLKHIRDELP